MTEASTSHTTDFDLAEFVQTLRASGYRVGIDQALAAQDLLVLLASRGELPLEKHRLRTLLSPVLARTPAEQADFYRHFEQWITAHDLTGKSEPEPDDDHREFYRIWRRLQGLVILLAIAAALAGVAWLIWGLAPSTFATKPSGSSAIAGKKPAEILNRSLGAIRISPSALLYTLLVFGGLGVLVVGAWSYWWWRQATRFLSSRPSSKIPRLSSLFMKPQDTALFRSPALNRVAQRLRRPRRYSTKDISVPASIEQTIRSGGLPCAVHAEGSSSPEYLAVIDSAGPADHFAKAMSAMFDRLGELGVFITRYFFRGDPRLCQPSGQPEQTHSLADLAGTHADHRLLICSDAGGLVNPATGEPLAALSVTHEWPHRFLLSPRPAESWTSSELAMERLGFHVTAADVHGLADVCQNLETGMMPDVQVSGDAVLPTELEEMRGDWLSEHQPDAATQRQLMETLLAFAGADGLHWMAACAVYPAIDWNLTLYLGRRLKNAAGLLLFSEEILLRLARLPWFRAGRMPEWLRTALLDRLPPAQRAEIRSAMNELFLGALKQESGQPLRVAANEDAAVVDHLSRWVFRILRREEKGGPMRDYVFAGFLTDRVRLKIPLALVRLLQRRRALFSRSAKRKPILIAAAVLLATAFVQAAAVIPALAIAEDAQFLTVRDLPELYTAPGFLLWLGISTLVNLGLLVVPVRFAMYGDVKRRWLVVPILAGGAAPGILCFLGALAAEDGLSLGALCAVAIGWVILQVATLSAAFMQPVASFIRLSPKLNGAFACLCLIFFASSARITDWSTALTTISIWGILSCFVPATINRLLRNSLPSSTTSSDTWEFIPTVSLDDLPQPGLLSRSIKRAIDIVGSLGAIVLTLPLYPFIIAAIWIEDGRPFFFGHKRETRHGREFRCWKFRSMIMDTGLIKQRLKREYSTNEDGPQFKLEHDPRLTRVGRFLRKTSLDELPEFWNVLIGDMSLVGPRPSPRQENQFAPAWREIKLSVRPGMTGLWQVRRDRHDWDFQEWIKFDIEYVHKQSLWLDLRIILQTFINLFRSPTARPPR